jgi:ATP-binding cassette subfamily B protein
MRSDYCYSEEGYQGKTQDWRLFRRLLPFVAPHRRMLMASVVLVVTLTVIELALPYFSKIAIDRYIVPSRTPKVSSSQANEPGQRYLYVDPAEPLNRAVMARHADLFETEGDRGRIAFADLARLPEDDLRTLRRDDMRALGGVVLIFLALVAAHFGLTFIQRVIMERAGHTVMHDLRLRLYEHIQQQGMSFFTRQPVARLVTRVTNDVQNMHELFTTFISMVFKDIFLLAGIAIILLVLDWRMALAVFGVMPLVAWAALFFSLKAREIYRALRVKVADINGRMAESIDGMRTIQTFGQERYNYERFAELNAENYRLGMREIHVFALFMPLIEVFGLLAMALLILYGGLQVVGGHISLGVLVVALTYVRMFFRPMRDLAENYNVLQNAMSSAERLFGLLDVDQRLPDSAEAHRPQSTPDASRWLELDHISMAYAPGEYVLREISFTVAKGQSVALVGPTGAGKTSLLNLIQRLYDPIEGQVRLDGRDLRQWDSARLRRLTALVTQEPVLFSTTVRRNIFPEPSSVDETTVARVIAAANCQELVRRLPQGLETVLEKGGAGLSSGERQLITIARALARDAQLILLDEATSYIDSQTEAAIYDALGRLVAGRTCLLVAHRLSTARMADRILVLRDGRLIEDGTHEQLMQSGGLYWRLHQQSGSAS